MTNSQKTCFEKATNISVTKPFLDDRTEWAYRKGYTKAKWVIFCETLLARDFSLSLYEARKTFSKYITVSDGTKKYKVRFSNHRPIRQRELDGDCDFFVGVTHTGTRKTEDAIKAVFAFFDKLDETE